MEASEPMAGEEVASSDRAAKLRQRLAHVYWLGGGSGGGKSTIAGRLAARHDLRVYDTDIVMSEHARRSTLDDAPHLSKFTEMDMDERWVHRSPRVMLETFHWYQGEAFDSIIEDLLALPNDMGVVAEGFRLLPDLVRPLLSRTDHAVWLLPTPEFRAAAFHSRGTAWDIPRRTNDPERALQNLLERDRMFTERLARDTMRLELPSIEVVPGMSEEELTELVAGSFGL